jgi:hypothetical protein
MNHIVREGPTLIAVVIETYLEALRHCYVYCKSNLEIVNIRNLWLIA